MKVMRRSRWLARLAAMLVVGVAGLVVAASAPLRSDGTVWAWGQNDRGQLGNGTTVSTMTPVKVTGLSHVTGIAAGYNAAVATATNGVSAVTSVWTWGANDHAGLGRRLRRPAGQRQHGPRHRSGTGHRPDRRHPGGGRRTIVQPRGPHRAVPGGAVEMRPLRGGGLPGPGAAPGRVPGRHDPDVDGRGAAFPGVPGAGVSTIEMPCQWMPHTGQDHVISSISWNRMTPNQSLFSSRMIRSVSRATSWTCSIAVALAMSACA